MGLAQLHKIDHIISEKRRVADTYTSCLRGIPGLQLPVELDWARNVYWMYAIVVKAEFGMTRDQLAETLEANGVQTRTFFCPMNQQPVLQSLPGFRDVHCPVADRLWDTGLYLPSSWNLSNETIRQIADSIRRAYERAREDKG
jgi:perosamine synthetase